MRRIISKTISGITDRFRGSSLKARSMRGATILGVSVVVERTLKLARNMLLARMLAPEAFGTMAMVITASSIFETFSDVGIRQSIIQSKKGVNVDYLNVAWWFQGLRGIGLYLVGILVAPWVGRFYNNMPELTSLMRMAFIAMIFNGLISPRVYVLEKKFQFAKFVFLTLVSGVLGTLLTIGLTFYLRNVRALVIGLVAETVILCLLSFVLCPFQPQLRIDKKCLSELLKFARGMLGLAFLTVIIRQTDVIVLGKVVSGEELGMYYLALQLASQPIQLFERIIGRVLLPVFAEKQDNKESICRAILAIARTTGVFGIPLLAFIISCASPILSLVYGSKYAEVAVPFSLLCLWGLVFTQAIKVASIFLGMGLPHLHRRAVALRGMLLASLIYPGTVYWRLSGAAAAVLVAYSITLVVQFVWLGKLIKLDVTKYMRSWLPGLLLSALVFITAGLLKFAKVGYDGINIVATGLACFIAFAFGIFYLIRCYKIT
jgi:lipopolysaccharide exporter